MDKLEPVRIHKAVSSDGLDCEIVEYDAESVHLRWRIWSGHTGKPWLTKTGEQTFRDSKTGRTYTLK